MFRGVPFPYYLFNVFFNFRWTVDNRKKKIARSIFYVLLFSRLFFVKLSIFVLAVVFLDKYQRYVFLFKQNGIIRFAFGNVFPHQINNIFCGNACYVSDQVDYVVD